MSSEWTDTTIGEICSKVFSGGTPTSTNAAYYEGGTVPWLRTKEVNYCKIYQTEQRITQLGLENSSAKLVPANSVIVAMYGNGDTAGRVAINKIPITTNQACCNLVVDASKADFRFVYYYLKGQYKALVDLKNGGAQQNLNGQLIKAFPITLPGTDEQREISVLLEALDDRITLLRETNATLEAIAQALFKSWFVDFDPVCAKMEGRAPEGMDEATAALFPDSLEETELGVVPRGWRVGTVANLGEVICGKTPPTSNPENYGDEVPFITIPDMHGFLVVTATNRSLSRTGADGQKKKYLPPGTVCVSCIATPGLVIRVTTESQTNQQINSVVPFSSWGKSFPLFLLRRIGDAVRAGGSGGSVFHNLSKSGFEELKVLLTSSEVAHMFDEFVEPLTARIESNQRQAQTLSTLRDTLLPRLISGQLQLPEVTDAN